MSPVKVIFNKGTENTLVEVTLTLAVHDNKLLLQYIFQNKRDLDYNFIFMDNIRTQTEGYSAVGSKIRYFVNYTD